MNNSENELRDAGEVYATLCNMLDGLSIPYVRENPELGPGYQISWLYPGETFSVHIRVKIIANVQLIRVWSYLPFSVPEDKRTEMAMAVSDVNRHLVEGCFVLNIRDKHMWFKLTSSYKESMIGEKLLEHILAVSRRTVNAYNEKFALLCMGQMTLDELNGFCCGQAGKTAELNAEERTSANEVFQTLCTALNELGYTYNRDEKNAAATFWHYGNDLAMDFRLSVDGGRQLTCVDSPLPFRFKKEKLAEGAMVTSTLNLYLYAGWFAYDIHSGEVRYWLTSSYRDSIVGIEMLKWMMSFAKLVVDEYNDKLFLVNEGKMTVDSFCKQWG